MSLKKWKVKELHVEDAIVDSSGNRMTIGELIGLTSTTAAPTTTTTAAPTTTTTTTTTTTGS